VGRVKSIQLDSPMWDIVSSLAFTGNNGMFFTCQATETLSCLVLNSCEKRDIIG
jgi:hypothetical protein